MASEITDPVACCPICGTSNIWSREEKTPNWACADGHQFERPAKRECSRRYGVHRAPLFTNSNMSGKSVELSAADLEVYNGE